MASAAATRVGIGVIIVREGTEDVLVGQRLGEEFEECARREVQEETGLEIARTARSQLPPATITFAHAVNSVFPSGAHYVTVFMRAVAPADAQPRNTEPHKCSGWHWVPWHQLAGLRPLFLPLEKLVRGGEYSPLSGNARGTGQPPLPEQAATAGERQPR